MTTQYRAIVLSALFSLSMPLVAKDKVTNVFDAPPARVYDAVYRYAQRHGKIKWADEKRFTLNGVVFVPGGNWDMKKDFDCTISVEATEDGKKSIVDVVGTFPAEQQSLVGSFGAGPAVKVLKAIREEFDRETAQLPKNDGTGSVPQQVVAEKAVEHTGVSDVSVKSTPEGAEITVDGKFAGNTPSMLKLPAGDHSFLVTAKGFQPWQRTVTLNSGASITVNATLESEPGQAQR
jgi:hypothetical protein